MTGNLTGDALVILYLICALFAYMDISWSNNDNPNYATYALMALGWPVLLVFGAVQRNRRVG